MAVHRGEADMADQERCTAFATCRIPTAERRLIDAAAAREGYRTASEWLRSRIRAGLEETFGPGAVVRPDRDQEEDE